ncbi:hypothetical protein Mal15_05150 [Stieleria maiorica]|uniref:DUF2306 domain-containing protein n=1 Tax=Stieleria maiorica TaxID=2795974 RepID=A0A5B9MBC0_9BACT|nr:DUF2306 domain-containing protein [Stieleria maiorica]QEF96487.1 hypothetical protein Mal15_05150 [Stieleria maiorica]
MEPLAHTHRSERLAKVLRNVLFWGCVIVSAKVFLAILYQYRWYFPPDFDASPFLAGRRFTFVGLYRGAFYLHLAAGPTALVLGTFLIFSGGKTHWQRLHAMLGKTQFAVVITMVVPSGLVMSLQAYAGIIAETGFIVQSILTGVTMAAAAFLARSGKFAAHRRWATRCYLLLWSPLLLRVVAGLLIVSNLESEWTYRLNAWLSWLAPLAVYELVLMSSSAETRAGKREAATAGVGRSPPTVAAKQRRGIA